jgi:hypothetical protein
VLPFNVDAKLRKAPSSMMVIYGTFDKYEDDKQASMVKTSPWCSTWDWLRGPRLQSIILKLFHVEKRLYRDDLAFASPNLIVQKGEEFTIRSKGMHNYRTHLAL